MPRSQREKAEITGDEEAPHATVAVEEGVDSLELHMGETDLEQGGQVGGGVEKTFHLASRGGHLLGRGRHEGGIHEGAAARADPVLRAPEFAGGEQGAAHPAQ